MGLCDFGKAETVGAVSQYSTTIDIEWSTADPTAFELGASHAGTHPLDDQVTLQ